MFILTNSSLPIPRLGASEGSQRSAGPLIQNAIVSRHEENYLICDLPSSNFWINVVASVKNNTLNAVFKLVMKSPGAVKKQKATSTATTNYVLSQEAARMASTLRPNTLDRRESSQANVVVSSTGFDFDGTINLHKKELYAHHTPNKKYGNNSLQMRANTFLQQRQ
ncbi:hypothetical protein PSTT_14022 [Puccinia striiformis]|uniref:Uncharacterized protein n=1 Tax=Puccinia striiformis TaxID=27350 RepID=A0A2S4UPH3_9BASI|nr:hypothetical protein PSTT_14022 [Puccinia striiformis]